MSKQMSSQSWPIASATEPTYVFPVLFNTLQGQGEQQNRVQGACDIFSAWPQGDGRKGHLPGYVSVTSKKEERRDTWSESNKSVKRTSYASGEEELAWLLRFGDEDDAMSIKRALCFC